jgi:hypothetical protein
MYGSEAIDLTEVVLAALNKDIASDKDAEKTN